MQITTELLRFMELMSAKGQLITIAAAEHTTIDNLTAQVAATYGMGRTAFYQAKTLAVGCGLGDAIFEVGEDTPNVAASSPVARVTPTYPPNEPMSPLEAAKLIPVERWNIGMRRRFLVVYTYYPEFVFDLDLVDEFRQGDWLVWLRDNIDPDDVPLLTSERALANLTPPDEDTSTEYERGVYTYQMSIKRIRENMKLCPNGTGSLPDHRDEAAPIMWLKDRGE